MGGDRVQDGDRGRGRGGGVRLGEGGAQEATIMRVECE